MAGYNVPARRDGAATSGVSLGALLSSDLKAWSRLSNSEEGTGEIVAKEETDPVAAAAKKSAPVSPEKTDNASEKAYSHVRVSLFPLYVKEVKSTWPECGRLRKAVSID